METVFFSSSLLRRFGVGLVCLVICGCITKYDAPGVEAIADILVVEGTITDDETTITLSRSINLTEDSNLSEIYVSDARIYVECDDGTQIRNIIEYNGSYFVKTGQLKLDRKYRLKIEIDEPDNRTYEYCSDFSYPLRTPEIDSIFWTKRGQGQPVIIRVATHEQENKILYYRWSYKEDWEIKPDYIMELTPLTPDETEGENNTYPYPYTCWNLSNSTGILLGSAEKTVVGKVTDILTEIQPSSRKLSSLYRITVKQNAISKRAYDYFFNIRKNNEQAGSIFGPIPSELRGNINCTTAPDRPVIGYIDVSSTTQKHRFIPRLNVYESMPLPECDAVPSDSLFAWFNNIPSTYILIQKGGLGTPDMYRLESCLDCRYYGITEKPDDWPDSH